MKPVHRRVLGVALALIVAGSAAWADDFEDARDAVNRGDLDAGLPRLQALADRGEPRAQNALGVLYERGRGVAQNDAEAVRWYRKAAEQGNAWGEDNLGMMYRDGRGVPKDAAEAARWFRKAAERGNAAGQNNLGVMYQRGSGVSKDDGEAVLWYRKAADQGLALAQDNLGVMLRDGRGVARDYAEAVRFFRLAADKGSTQAQENLGVMYRTGRGVAQDDAEALRWFRKAVESGRASAQAEIAYMYETGRGVAMDEAAALRWYWNAANQGNAYAQRRLATMYRDGRGAERNADAAIEWFGRAAAQGDEGARAALVALQDERKRTVQERTIVQAVKAADADAPPSTAAHDERAALAHEIIEVSGARLKFERMVTLAGAADFSKIPVPIPDNLKDAVRTSFLAAFSSDALVALTEANLSANLDVDALRTGLEWERSPLGQRMNELEREVSPERVAFRQELERQYRSKGNFGADARARGCAQADALGDQTESMVPYFEASIAAGVLMGAELDGGPVDMEAVQRSVTTIRPMLREAARIAVMSSCLTDYRMLSEAEFEQWLDFLHSRDGGRYIRGAYAALRQAMVARAAVMAQALLEAVRQYKRDTKTS